MSMKILWRKNHFPFSVNWNKKDIYRFLQGITLKSDPKSVCFVTLKEVEKIDAF